MQEQRPDDLDRNTLFLYCDIKPLRFFQARFFGGGGGIRTHGTFARTTVFETAPFDHSGTPPQKIFISLFNRKLPKHQYPSNNLLWNHL